MNIPAVQPQQHQQSAQQPQQGHMEPQGQSMGGSSQHGYQFMQGGGGQLLGSHMNMMASQHPYVIPPPFGNVHFAAQRQPGVPPQPVPVSPQGPGPEQQEAQAPPGAGVGGRGPRARVAEAQPQAQFSGGGLPRRIPMSHMLSSYPVRKYLSNMALLRAHEVVNQVNQSMGKVDDYEYWSRFTKDIFAPDGVLRYARKNGDDTRLFEFAMPIIPSLLKFLGSTGVVRIEMVPQQLHVQVLSNGTIFFEHPRCPVTYFYPDGSYMANFSRIKGIFDASLKIEWCDVCTYSFVPGIEWNSLERVLSDQKVSQKIFQALAGSNAPPDTVPDGNKDYSLKMDQQMPANFSAITQLRSQFKVFHNISSFGLHESLMRVLQVNDVMSYLKNLKVYQRVNNIQSPLESLRSFVAAAEERRRMSQPTTSPTKTTASAPMHGSAQQNPQANPSGLFMATMAYNPAVPKNERKSFKKRPSSEVLLPLSSDDAMKSPMDGSDPDRSSNPYKKMKF
ncbi:ABL177Wp [Eremothecium gossypii ATCC 10895]|uniref:ABL177Wp n=1 Tax=Eremothecium gossypii (strain ATCC 10895 / CBS 109.51 / FGSC 9923 / NRRL Y-1056) TaxID=284811 RepID=Q75E47_EREGS|nr:ABL177Wp [Eremothecium gossypii ATCC 10895]AAS50594.1 ABL177Wp [Eremothecium gossypii ATCC 10895]AEY94882.1 FABL177Wp [Eremothecium gossypii FDAG1]